MANPVDIFHFTHFRKFLSEYQAARAELDPSFTRTEVCNLLGLPKTRSYFSDVLRGKKVSARMVERFVEVLELPRREAQYFRAMVELDQAKTEAARKAAMDELLKINPNAREVLDPDAYEFYAKWYHGALFAILDVMDVGDDLTAVQKRIYPHVTLGKLRESLALLERLGLARKDDSGFWKPTRDALSSGAKNNSEVVRQYQLQCFELSKQALLSPSKKKTAMSTMVFSVSAPAYKKLEEEVERFKANVRRIVAEDADAADDVCHLNLHLFSNLGPEGK